MYFMREKTQNKINANINAINAITIVDNHIDTWKKQQLITKHQILLQHLNDNIDTDMEKFSQILREVQIEIDELIAKWI